MKLRSISLMASGVMLAASLAFAGQAGKVDFSKAKLKTPAQLNETGRRGLGLS